MINTKIILRILGSLLFIEANIIFICLITALCYGENDMLGFLITFLVCIGGGVILKLLGHGATNGFGRRDGYVVVSMTWVLFSLIGMLPFLISGWIKSPVDALFETMSGFTSTGCSIIDNLDSFPHSLLLWRSISQWFGGLGIVFFTLAVLPMLGVGNVKLFAAEATGLKADKLHAKISTTAKWIWMIYTGLTLLCAVCLKLAGMSTFDSINHALTCTSTGGFSTHQASIMWFNSPTIEYILSLFMFLSGINFTLFFVAFFKQDIKQLIHDRELATYIVITIAATSFFAYCLASYNGYDTEQAIRAALFQTTSIATSTGYVSNDFMQWVPATWAVIAMLMFCGGCAGSTAGGMKYIRLNVIAKIVRNEFKQLIHPTAVIPIRDARGKVLPASAAASLLAFVFLYIMLILIGMVIMLFCGESYLDALSISISAISNNGPAIGTTIGATSTWSSLPDVAKITATLLMLIGRLEMFSILILFSPKFWEKR